MSRIVCQVCFKLLKSHSSIVAGMGPVCSDRMRFAENATMEELETMKGAAEVPNSRSLLPFRNVILEEKTKNNTLASILGVNNGTIILVDRQKLKEEYNNSRSYSEAFAKSINLLANHEISSVHELVSPDNPEIRRAFNKFQKEHKASIREREEQAKANASYELDFSFGNAESLRDLTDEQKENRAEMDQFKNSDPNKFNTLFGEGEFHLATVLKRLESSNFNEVLEVRKQLLKRYTPRIEVKDYGLTQNEIIQGLQASNKNLEKNLYRAFSEGNTNLVAITEILNKQPSMEVADKMLSLKVINVLTQDKYMSHGHKDTQLYEQIRNFIKKHNLPVHSNWLR